MRYEIELDDRHTAPGDALLTALLFLKLLKKGKKKGFKNFKDLMKNF
jgi:DNA polymerase-3 subunit epsilon